MIIRPAHLQDLPEMLGIYARARDYQIKVGQAAYPLFKSEDFEDAIKEGTFYKIVINEKSAAFFNIGLEDELIWDKRENHCSVYLHRIVTHPDFKGKNLMQTVTDFATGFAKTHNRSFVRMDTWNNNEPLKNYYLKFGFQIVGTRLLPKDSRLNSHYWGETCVYLELKIN